MQREVLQVGTDNADLLQVQKRQLAAIQAQLSALLKAQAQAQAQSPTAAAGAGAQHKAEEMMSARFEDIKFLEALGRGAFGVVYKVQWRGQIGAAKVCFIQPL